ncbi:hypothetical protein AXH21_13335, partial [Acinetobacter pittii]
MLYIPYVLMGILCVLCWTILWYIIRPTSYFLVKEKTPFPRLQIFLHHILAIFILFVLLAIFIPDDGTTQPSNIDIILFLLSIVGTITFLIYFGKNKIDLIRKKEEVINNQPVQPV